MPPWIFRETTGIRKETIRIFLRNLWRKYLFPKRVLTKNPPFFRKSPGGILDGFLTGRLTKKFPTISGRNFPEISRRRIFGNSENFQKISWQVFWRSFSQFSKSFMKVYVPTFSDVFTKHYHACIVKKGRLYTHLHIIRCVIQHITSRLFCSTFPM